MNCEHQTTCSGTTHAGYQQQPTQDIRRDKETRAGQQEADVATRFDSGRHVDLLAFDTYAHTSQRESKASDGAFEVTNKEEARWQERRDDRRGEAR